MSSGGAPCACKPHEQERMGPEDDNFPSQRDLHRRAILRHLAWLLASLLVGGGAAYYTVKREENRKEEPAPE